MKKPCQDVHGDFKDGCSVCRKWRDDPRYSRAPEPVSPTSDAAALSAAPRQAPFTDRVFSDSVTLRVRKAGCSQGCWRWVVLEDDRPVDGGKSPTEPQAWSDAEDAARTITEPAAAQAAPPVRKAAQFEWVTAADLARDAVRLAGLLPADVSGIVGVPRSGMGPAAIIATVLHVPLYELTPSGQLHECGSGVRGASAIRSAGPLAVVDDTVYSGQAMRRVKKQMAGRPHVLAAVYVESKARSYVDVWARDLPCPHLLEWNLFNCGVSWGSAVNPVFGKGVATDLDGIVCHDATSGGKPGTPYLLPRMAALPLIATGRPERTRPETEAWLHKHRVKYKRLAMLSDGADHTSGHVIAAFKAAEYAASGCGFFVESDPEQAAEIARITSLPVICPRAGRVF